MIAPPFVAPKYSADRLTLIAGPTLAYVKPPASVPLCTSGFVTTTSTTPAACAGVVAVIVPAPTTTTPVARHPQLHHRPRLKTCVPETVTDVPPFVGPTVGLTPVTPGAAAQP